MAASALPGPRGSGARSIFRRIRKSLTRSRGSSVEDAKGGELDVPEEERRPLVRVSSCAVFHKLTPGSGVPHSFVGFVRQWPALPRVVVSSFPPFCDA